MSCAHCVVGNFRIRHRISRQVGRGDAAIGDFAATHGAGQDMLGAHRIVGDLRIRHRISRQVRRRYRAIGDIGTAKSRRA